MILHQKANFIGSIDRQYDDSFAKDGAKIGDTLRIRQPNRFVIRTGETLSAQDTRERNLSLSVSSRMGVDLNFSSTELTLSLDDFAERILDPAMSVLAANLDYAAMDMLYSVNHQINNHGNPLQFRHVLNGRKLLQDSLTPLDKRSVNLNTQDNVDLVDGLKGLFNNQKTLNEQYTEGYMGRTAGFDFLENTLWPRLTRGAATTAYVVGTTSSQGDSTLAITTGTGAWKRGDIFTIANVFRIHPETRQSTGVLMQFVVTADTSGGAGNLPFSPAVYSLSTGGNAPYQNCNALPQSGASLVVAGTINTSYGISMMYQKGAFTFATADLVMPNGVDFKAREVLDGISMRIIRQYDINNDAFPCRIDVHYGTLAQRPGLACRLAAN